MLVEGATFPPCLYCIRQCTCILSGHAATMCQCIGDDIASHISHFPCCTGTSLDFAVIYFQSWFCLHLTVCTSLSKHFYPMDTAYDSSLYVFFWPCMYPPNQQTHLFRPCFTLEMLETLWDARCCWPEMHPPCCLLFMSPVSYMGGWESIIALRNLEHTRIPKISCRCTKRACVPHFL